MQAGSTGLGKITLKMNLAEESDLTRFPPTSPPDDALVFYCKSYDPVVWNIWISIDEDELPGPMCRLLRPKILWFAMKALLAAPFHTSKKPHQAQIRMLD